jgi:hypothetical protein
MPVLPVIYFSWRTGISPVLILLINNILLKISFKNSCLIFCHMILFQSEINGT